MAVTARQRRILDRLPDVVQRVTRAKAVSYFLDGEDVKSTVYSLIVRGLVIRNPNGQLSHPKTEPDAAPVSSWTGVACGSTTTGLGSSR